MWRKYPAYSHQRKRSILMQRFRNCIMEYLRQIQVVVRIIRLGKLPVKLQAMQYRLQKMEMYITG